MKNIDWSVLSGPRVTRRTLMKLAAATGAIGYANVLGACGGDDSPDATVASTATSAVGGGAMTPTSGATAATGNVTSATGAATAPTESSPVATDRDPNAKEGGELRLGFGIGQVLTLDPAQVTQGIVAGELVANLFSSLVQFDEELGILPDLADDWEVNEAGTEYTFYLRSGLTFHNGDPLVAGDFVYTYERTIAESFASPHANKLSGITDISATDELTLSLTLEAPFAPFLAVACSRGPGRALTPISKRAIDELGDEQFGITPVGCGPFMMVAESAEVGKGFEMVAFEDWYGGRPLLDKIIVEIIPEPSSRVSALEAGDVDMLDILPTSGYELVSANDQISIVEASGTNWIGLTMNFTRPPWDNPDARMAVAKAIDRQEYIDKVLFGLATPGIGAIAPAFGWVYVPPADFENPQEYNLDEAKTLAERAGLAGTKAVLLSSADDARGDEVIRSMLTDIGLDVQLDQLQSAAANERWLAGDYDMNVNGSVVDADPDDGHWNFFYSEGPWNTYGYNNPKADELMEATRSTLDQDERRALWQEVQELLAADVAYVFLYHAPDLTAFHNDVKGYRPVPEMRYLESVWLDR